MPRSGSRKCLNCHAFFQPHPCSKGRQKFCSMPECQRASKRHSQQQWLGKPENQDYFRGPDNVRRVQLWRQQNPSYSQRRNKRNHSPVTLQDPLTVQPVDIVEEKDLVVTPALQEVLCAQPVVLIGLIAHLTGAALQDELLESSRRLRQLGEDFLYSPTAGDSHHDESLTRSPTMSEGASPVQLGRSPPGA